MSKKFFRTAELLGLKLKAFSRVKPEIRTYGTPLTGDASAKTQGSDGYFAENNFAKPSKPGGH